MIRERCSCGAEFETDEQDAPELVADWRELHQHEVPAVDVGGHTSGFAVIEQAPDFTRPELHIGFRSDDW